MNRLVVSILLLALMSAGCFWSVFITIDKTNELSGYIDQVEQAHSEGDSEAAVKYANQLTTRGIRCCTTAFSSTTSGTRWR